MNTLSIIALLSGLFKQVFIIKPFSSKAYNSEIYIICKNYVKYSKFRNKIINILIDHMKTKNKSPIITSFFNVRFICQMNIIMKKLRIRQTYFIEQRTYLFNKLYDKSKTNHSNIKKYLKKSNYYEPNHIFWLNYNKF